MFMKKRDYDLPKGRNFKENKDNNIIDLKETEIDNLIEVDKRNYHLLGFKEN